MRSKIEYNSKTGKYRVFATDERYLGEFNSFASAREGLAEYNQKPKLTKARSQQLRAMDRRVERMLK